MRALFDRGGHHPRGDSAASTLSRITSTRPVATTERCTGCAARVSVVTGVGRSHSQASAKRQQCQCAAPQPFALQFHGSLSGSSLRELCPMWLRKT